MTTRLDQCPRTAYVASNTALAALVLGIALPVALLIWQAAAPRVPIRSGEVGHFLWATSESSLLRPMVTNIQTTDGRLVVTGRFSAPRGQTLQVVEFNQDSITFLCSAGDSNTCLPLAGTWAGAMETTATADRAFDFGRYGLTSSNLWLWLACGCLVCLLSVFIRFVALIINANADGRAHRHPRFDGPRA